MFAFLSFNIEFTLNDFFISLCSLTGAVFLSDTNARPLIAKKGVLPFRLFPPRAWKMARFFCKICGIFYIFLRGFGKKAVRGKEIPSDRCGTQRFFSA